MDVFQFHVYFSIVKALVGTFNKKKTQIEAVSGHCEILRNPVGISKCVGLVAGGGSAAVVNPLINLAPVCPSY